MKSLNASGGVLVGFLADLRLVACGFALVLYGAWAFSPRPGLVGLGRLSLVVAFGATVLAYATALAAPHQLPYLDLFLFALLALFLMLEFLFQLSILGVGVSALAAAIAIAPYLPAGWAPSAPPAPPNALVAYWGVLRDLIATGGAAALALGLGAGILLRFVPDRRGGKLVHPNDLRDATALLARLAAPAFALATAAGVVAWMRHPAPGWHEIVHLNALAILVFGSLAWLVQAEGRDWGRRLVVPLVCVNVVALAALLVGDPVIMYLTRASSGP